MIPINQLRVGSYWQLNTKTGQVLKIVTPCEIADAAEYGIGIELTPEVLEKCGFKYHNNVDDFDTWDNKIEIWEHDKGFCHNYAFGGDTKYLHQLQNLHFALIGEELEYKP